MMTMFVSKILSVTLLSGERSAFALELPPYRKPRILKTIVSSFLDRTLFVLGRAVIVAIPAGALIWLLANIYIADSSLLSYCMDFFDPFGRAIGLDGVIIMAFVLGFPANETVIPIIIMSYLSTGTLTDLQVMRNFCIAYAKWLDAYNGNLYNSNVHLPLPLLHNLPYNQKRNG